MTGYIEPEWKLFTIDEWNQMKHTHGKNVLRDEYFDPKLFSEAVSESEMHGQGSGAIIENSKDATDEILSSFNEQVLAQKLSQAKRDLHQEYGQNPALVNRLAELWGAETNNCGVVVENVENIVLIENPSLHAGITLYETKK